MKAIFPEGNKSYNTKYKKIMSLTSVSSVGSRSAFVLNLPVQGWLFVLGVIVPIPPHTPNITPIKFI